MSWIEALVLGLLQGLTEYLPVSSSGHLAIGSALFGIEGEENLTFTIEKAALSVSAGYSVTPLGYGQQLVRGQEVHIGIDKKYRSASDIIKNANVTIASNGTAVTGWWEWTDENYVGKILNASSRSDNADYGDGYQVIATFHPTSLDEKNFETLEQQFLVEIARATPDYKNCGAYIKEGADHNPNHIIQKTVAFYKHYHSISTIFYSERIDCSYCSGNI